MSAKARAIAAGACALALSCAHGRGDTGARAESDLRIWVSPVVRWGPGAARELRFLIENASRRTIVLAGPDPAHARVDVYAGPEKDRVCGGASPPAGETQEQQVALAPGDGVEMRIDLAEACRDVPPGEYRFVVSYKAPAPGRDAKLWAGSLPARYGTLVVEQGTAEAPTPR